MRYIAEMSYKRRVIDTLILETDDRDEAIRAAKNALGHLTDREKADLEYLYVIESANPDPDADDHFDGDIIWEYTGEETK